jgi:hypothetical protein
VGGLNTIDIIISDPLEDVINYVLDEYEMLEIKMGLDSRCNCTMTAAPSATATDTAAAQRLDLFSNSFQANIFAVIYDNMNFSCTAISQHNNITV